MIYTIEEIKKITKNVFSKKDFIEEAYLFGSYAKGNAKDDSDVDIIAITNKQMDRNFFSLYPELEDELGKRIDIYCDKELEPRFYNSIRKDLIKIYERQNTNIL